MFWIWQTEKKSTSKRPMFWVVMEIHTFPFIWWFSYLIIVIIYGSKLASIFIWRAWFLFATHITWRKRRENRFGRIINLGLQNDNIQNIPRISLIFLTVGDKTSGRAKGIVSRLNKRFAGHLIKERRLRCPSNGQTDKIKERLSAYFQRRGLLLWRSSVLWFTDVVMVVIFQYPFFVHISSMSIAVSNKIRRTMMECTLVVFITFAEDRVTVRNKNLNTM